MSNSGPPARARQHSVRKALLLGCAVALLGAACGQRGPLYLPEQGPPAAATTPEDARGEEARPEEEKDEQAPEPGSTGDGA
jgi:predicted small lipoprotein YifL